MANIPQVERQIYLLRLLALDAGGSGLCVEDIEKRFLDMGIEVSRKTIRRDIEDLTFYYYISEDTRGKTTYFTADKVLLGDLGLGINDVMAVYFTHKIMRAYRGLDLGAASCRLLDELIRRASPSGNAHVEAFEQLLKVKPEKVLQEENIDRQKLNDLREAIKDGKRLLIDYQAFSTDKVTRREFDPYVLEIYEGCYHLIGFCHLRKAIRDLRVARMLSAADTGKRFTRPENFYEELTRDRFGIMASGEKITLKIHFTGKAAKLVKEYERDKADRLEEKPDGSLIFIKETTLSPEIKSYVLKYGAQAEVLSPVSLREEIAREALALSSIYGAK
jgi:predicted DNA-binding transcriptional regulator YafY